MKYLLILFLTTLATCEQTVPEDNLYFVEQELSFYNPYEPEFTVNEWIRKPDNLIVAHESFKKFGYKNIFLSNQYQLNESSCWIPGAHGWVNNKTCRNIIDSLIINYPIYTEAPTYYMEFWVRRKNEENDSVVFQILKEIQAELMGNHSITINEEAVNDTIVNLLKIQNDTINNQTALNHFNYLNRIGLDKSAYNLLYERYEYYPINWNRDSLRQGLLKDSIECCQYAIFEDNTK